MRRFFAAILSLFVVLSISHSRVQAKGLSTGDGSRVAGESALRKPEYRRYAGDEKKGGSPKSRSRGGGGVGITITIDPSVLFKPGKKKKPAPVYKKRRTKKKKKPAKKRLSVAPPGSGGPCPKFLVNLMGDAGYWREQAEAADAEAAMARDAARGWRAISRKAAEGSAYAGKSGLTSSEKFLGDKAAELEQRAKDYEAKAGEKEATAKALREKADAEDGNRADHEKEWCVKYRKSPRTAYTPEAVKISTAPGNAGVSNSPDVLRNQIESAEKAQADARFKDRVAEAEKAKADAAKRASRQREADVERDDRKYEEHDVMYLDKKLYTADDMKDYFERWSDAPDQNDPVIFGPGQGLGPDILELAQWRPDLAATLLNMLNELETGDLEGALAVVKLIRQQTAGLLKIANEFGKPLESWGEARMDNAVERMETTLERQIRQDSKPEVTEKTPASTTTEPATTTGETPTPARPNDGTQTGIPVTFAPVPVNGCVERIFNLSSDADYWRELADIEDTGAAMARESAKRWREISKQSAEGAKQAGKAKLKDSQKFQEDKAAELEQRAKDSDARADQKEAEAKSLREAADAEDRKRAELEKERCRTREDLPRNAFSPEPVKISTGPENPPSSKIPTAPKTICGPDITDNVFRVLDKIHKDWRSWDSSTKAKKCISLFTSLSAWDIRALAPGYAPPTETQYEERYWNGTGSLTEKWKKFLGTQKFWFEDDAPACGKPRLQCTSTVTFLGKCVHPQVVNYVQWGVMNRLCSQEGAGKAARSLYSSMAPGNIFDGQKIMSGVGSAYTAATDAGSYYNPQSADPGEKQGRYETVRKMMKDKLEQLMAEPGNSDFASRPAINCSTPCQMTAAEKDKLSKRNFGYVWGK